jgi:hypothetical protein
MPAPMGTMSASVSALRERSLFAMPEQPRKMSEIMKEMAETLLRDPGGVPSSEAAHVALFFANVAWNESVGLDFASEGYRNVWQTIEAEKPGALGRVQDTRSRCHD